MLESVKQSIKVFLNSLGARIERYFRGREIVKVLKVAHAIELRGLGGEQWALTHQRHVQEIMAVKRGDYDIIDRRSWAYPYIPECMDEQSEILTKRGFKNHQSIQRTDEVATRNPETGELEWIKPERIIRDYYKGKMILFKGRGYDHLFTPNHEMVGQYLWADYGTGKWQSKVASDGLLSAPDSNLPNKQPGEYRTLAYRWKGRGTGQRGNKKSEFGRACAQDIAKYQARYKSKSSYGFEVPFGAKWKGKFPANLNKWTNKLRLDCLYTSEKRYASAEPVYVDLDDYIAFLALYLAEGYAWGATNLCGAVKPKRYDKRSKFIQSMAAAADFTVEKLDEHCKSLGYLVGVTQVRTSKHFDEIQALLDRLPWNWVRRGETWDTSSKTLHSHIAPCGNTYTKSIPQWVKDLPPKYLNLFLDWYTKGDGWLYDSGARNIKTTSPRMSEDLQELFLKVGRQAKVTVTQPEDRCPPGENVDTSRLAPSYMIEESLGRFRCLPQGKEVPYIGWIWCVDVPPNATIFVRRHGKGVWTGNSLHRLNQPI